MKRFKEDLMVSEELAEKYEEVMNLLNQLPGGREKSLAITNLEHSALWAGVAERVAERLEQQGGEK
jgi:hypothetical protein